MRNRLKNYLIYIEKRSNEDLEKDERNKLIADLLIQISFFQHERLIHLIVTVSFALLAMLTFFAALAISLTGLWLLFIMFLLLLVPYILHYYRLENGVQKLYGFYDRLCAEI